MSGREYVVHFPISPRLKELASESDLLAAARVTLLSALADHVVTEEPVPGQDVVLVQSDNVLDDSLVIRASVQVQARGFAREKS